jgi:flagellar protein FliO/FliZ
MNELLLMTSGLVFVVCLMVGFAYLIKRFGLSESSNFLNPHSPKSLKILEQLPVDTRRKLILVQAGKRNHLIMLGAQSETLIDSDVSLTTTLKTEKGKANVRKKA